MKDDVPGVEMLPEVDVKDAPLSISTRHSVHEIRNSAVGNRTAAGKGAEADGAGLGCKFLKSGSKWNIVPGCRHVDVVLRYAGGIKVDADGAGGEIHAADHCPESEGSTFVGSASGYRLLERIPFFGSAGVQFPDYCISCLVPSDSTDCYRIQTELRYVVCEVCRSSAESASFRQHIPEDLADAYDVFSFHDGVSDFTAKIQKIFLFYDAS